MTSGCSTEAWDVVWGSNRAEDRMDLDIVQPCASPEGCCVAVLIIRKTLVHTGGSRREAAPAYREILGVPTASEASQSKRVAEGGR